MNYDEDLNLPLDLQLKHLFDFRADIEARVKQLENYIGDIKQLKFYANSLQETLDRYVSPLYIEKTDNEGNNIYIDSYLGRPNEIPPYSMIKVRASHTLQVPENNPGTKIIFKRGEDVAEYPLMKMASDDNLFKELEDGDFVNGNVYEIYFNAQNIAIISSSNAGVTALNIAQTLNKTVENLKETIDKLGITDTGMTVSGKITATDIVTDSVKVNNTMNIETVKDLVLPAGTTTPQRASTDQGIVNKEYMAAYVDDAMLNFFGEKHLVGTQEASIAMDSRENNSFYFKIGE